MRETQQVGTTRGPELRARNAAGRRHAQLAGARGCAVRGCAAVRGCDVRAGSRCLQAELLGKFLFHLVLIKNIGENDLLVLWNIGDEILEVASNNEEVSRARSNVGNG